MRRLVILTTLSLGLVIASSSPAAAQSKRKPKPLATPLPTLSGAEIISRSGDYDEPAATTTPQRTTKPANATSSRIRDLSQRMDKLEASKKEDPEARERRMLLNLDILTRAEQRSESLRKQLFEMTEKENTIRMRLDQIDIDSRPEMIERSVQIAGTLRPEEVRESKRKSLESERTNLSNMLTQLELSKATVATSLEKADALVEKLRARLDKEIDDALLKEDPKEEGGRDAP